MAGNTMGPVAMLIIGMLMADMDMQHLALLSPALEACAAATDRTAGYFGLRCQIRGLAALAPHGETLIILSLLSVIAPSANIVTQFSQMFGRDALYASLINTVTMLLCIITMPLMITLFQM